MSNVGQGFTAIVGGIIGFYVGGPTGAAYGFQIGLGAGSLLFPTQLAGVTGPKLEDLNTASVQVGAPLPFVRGVFAVTGTVMYLGPIETSSTTETVGGKGPPEQDVTTFHNRQSIGIGICEAPPEGMSSVSRIWENGDLVFDARTQLPDESDEDYAARVAAAAAYAPGFVFYDGSDTQEPDPTIELEKGVGNVPAWRRLCWLMMPHRELRSDQGQRHPVFRIEVNQASSYPTELIYTNVGVTPWNKPPPSSGFTGVDVTRCQAGAGGGGSGAISQSGTNRGGGRGGGGGGVSQELGIDADDLPDTVDVTVGGGGLGGAPRSGSAQHGETGFAGGNSSFGSFCVAEGGEPGRGGVSASSVAPTPAASGDGGSGTLSDGGDGGEGGTGSGDANPGGDSDYGGGGGGGGGSRDISGPTDAAPGGDGFAAGGSLRNAGGDAATEQGTNGRDGETATDFGDEDDSPDPYVGGGGGGGGTTALVGATAIGGTGGDGGDFGGGGGGGGAAASPSGISGGGGRGKQGYVKLTQHFASSAQGLTLAQAISMICERVGLAANQVDVLDHVARGIIGLGILSQTNARAALGQLVPLGPFDVVRSGAQLVFPKRGKAIVASIPEEDLGAHADSEEPPPITHPSKQQDPELPRLLRLNYPSVARDYENGQQLSPVRITTDATQDIDMQLAIVPLEDDDAARTVEIVWADAWESQWTDQIALDQRYAQLEPADCVEIPVDGRLQRVRMMAIEDVSNGLIRRCDVCRDNDGTYISRAVATPPDRPENSLKLIQPTELILLDVPALREEDDDAGVYAACIPSGSGNAWTGAVIHRSIDGGSAFTQVASVTAAATVGTLISALPDGQTATFDESAEFVVEFESGTPESRTELAVLNGANAAAIGGDGRWQIIQFKTAVQISPTQWRLTGILRGRRGTEHLAGDSLIGDRFVLVSGPGIIRLSLQSSEIGASRTYKAVSIGTNYATGVDQEFTGSGEALETFSPVFIAGARDGPGNLTISWIRRDRLSQTLRSGVDVPLSEASESYSIDILSGTDVVRTLTSSTQQVVYSAANQTTDFGSPQAQVGVRVYQLSAIVGRGTPGEATV